ncbi:hypothetical protein BD413DRAFT_580527 [Trametes elegans]|nr:hypothetical protein BD413DRAFT_580527 [Trametes elegans]
MSDVWFRGASTVNISQLAKAYPSDRAAESPFGIGNSFAFTHGYKRIAAFQGDFIMQAPRRFLLNHGARKQRVRSFCKTIVAQHWSSYLKVVRSERMDKIRGLGAAHSIDLANVFGPGGMTDFLIHCVNTLDPNVSPESEVHWPPYTVESLELLVFAEGKPSLKHPI